MTRRFWLLLVLLLALLGAALLLPTARQAPVVLPSNLLVGRAQCAQCHAAEAALYVGSHHDRAMDVPTSNTVLGDFADAQFTQFGVTTTFRRAGERYLVHTEGSDGALHEFPVAYVFGFSPLQQYLIAQDGGRLQCLTIAWDSRPKPAGGQRWFSLYPNERIAPGDELHWTGLQQNWNFMCAECHSTQLQRGYDSNTGHYHTTWAELDVSCEACHGPGSHHVAWANGVADFQGLGAQAGRGLNPLTERRNVHWLKDPATGKPVRSQPRTTSTELETCAQCHARRTTHHEPRDPRQPLLDTHRPALLTLGLFHSNGLMQDEVYTYQSFLQSRMHEHGVTCSDCHEPHSGTLRAPGNQVCLQCHDARLDQKEHHFHQAGQPGSRCVDCHMPEVTYMGVDVRHDHALQVPRPEHSVAFGTPNACNQCHREQTPQWADAVLRARKAAPASSAPWTEAFAAARNHRAAAQELLAAVLADASQPAMVRATAIHELSPPFAAATARQLAQALRADAALLRLVATEKLSEADSADPTQLLPQLQDPTRAVRMAAARALLHADQTPWSAAQRQAWQHGLTEYTQAQQANADRPEAQLNLGNLAMQRGDHPAAAAAFQQALALLPTFAPARVNLADLHREQGHEAQCEAVLREGLRLAANDAELQHALGLSLVRQQRLADAVLAFGTAARAARQNPRYAYVYAVALQASNRLPEAIAELSSALRVHDNDAELWQLLIEYQFQAGETASAHATAAEFLRRWPDAPASAELRARMQR